MRRGRARALTALVGLASVQCAVGPDFVRPPPPASERYVPGPPPVETVTAMGELQKFAAGSPAAKEWWRRFRAGPLDEIVAASLAANPSLQAAEASLRRSEASLRAGQGIFWPRIDAALSAERQLFSPTRFGFARTSSVFNLYTASATVTYPLDVFGGERRNVETLSAQVDAQRANVGAAYLTLTGNVVNAVIARAGYEAELAATRELVASEREQLELTKAQAKAGTAPYANVLALQAALSSAEATLPPLAQGADHSTHLLATLAGRPPAEWVAPGVALADLKLPETIPTSLPSTVVRQRPDVLLAEAQLHGFAASVGVATAALLPTFALNGGAGVNSTSVSNLFSEDNGFWSYGATAAIPLFHGGAEWYGLVAADEAYQASLSTYRAVVLDALAQVGDALRALEHDAEALRATSEQLDAAKAQVGIVHANYEAGIANYLQVLIADVQLRQALLADVRVRAQRLQDTVALFVALGGGWEEGGSGAGTRP